MPDASPEPDPSAELLADWLAAADAYDIGDCDTVADRLAPPDLGGAAGFGRIAAMTFLGAMMCAHEQTRGHAAQHGPERFYRFMVCKEQPDGRLEQINHAQDQQSAIALTVGRLVVTACNQDYPTLNDLIKAHIYAADEKSAAHVLMELLALYVTTRYATPRGVTP